MPRNCRITGPDNAFEIGRRQPLAIIAGPCVLESLEMALRIGAVARDACRDLGFNYIFKASFDKANRTSAASPRGPGIDIGLARLAEVRRALRVPVTTDIHEPAQAGPVAEVVDVLQIPAFLCRQSDLLEAAGAAAARHARAVNIKKGQFLSPREMAGPVEKVERAGCTNIMLTERGTFFGYHRLVNDFIGIGDLMALGEEASPPRVAPPVCFDCTHSAQLPGESATTGGRRDRVELLARAAAAVPVDALFLECHPDPPSAWSDAATQLPLDALPGLLRVVKAISSAAGK